MSFASFVNFYLIKPINAQSSVLLLFIKNTHNTFSFGSNVSSAIQIPLFEEKKIEKIK